jgi:hypothetical protein
MPLLSGKYSLIKRNIIMPDPNLPMTGRYHSNYHEQVSINSSLYKFGLIGINR